jgi:hypothetical protein
MCAPSNRTMNNRGRARGTAIGPNACASACIPVCGVSPGGAQARGESLRTAKYVLRKKRKKKIPRAGRGSQDLVLAQDGLERARVEGRVGGDLVDDVGQVREEVALVAVG